MSRPPLLQVTDLRAWFDTERGPARAVDGVSFRVEKGERVGLVGESGCGKTVTSLSLLRLLPTPPARILEGSSVRLRGEELLEASEARLREIRGNDVSMIFQDPMSSLNPVYTVGEQIVEVLRAHRGLGRREARDRARSLLEEVGLPDAGRRLDDHPHLLSGGMRQRVMIAMALSCEPDLLVADEPTTALDVTIQAQILELLLELGERRGMAVLLVSHDLGVVAEVCDRVLVMYAGQVVERGRVEDVFLSPRHPYTRGLLDSRPAVDDPARRLRSIPGSVPEATGWPPGCRFRDRCAFGVPACAGDQELVAIPPEGHAVRCCRAGDLGVLDGEVR